MSETKNTWLELGDVVRFRADSDDQWHQGEIIRMYDSGMIVVRPDRLMQSHPDVGFKVIRDVAAGKSYIPITGDVPHAITITKVGHRVQPEHPDDDTEERRLRRWLQVIKEVIQSEVNDTTTRALLDQCADRALGGEQVGSERDEPPAQS